jgi:hypothetical protein
MQIKFPQINADFFSTNFKTITPINFGFWLLAKKRLWLLAFGKKKLWLMNQPMAKPRSGDIMVDQWRLQPTKNREVVTLCHRQKTA